jgi:hypothetical protein
MNRFGNSPTQKFEDEVKRMESDPTTISASSNTTNSNTNPPPSPTSTSSNGLTNSNSNNITNITNSTKKVGFGSEGNIVVSCNI